MASWPPLPLETWSATCDTLHAHVQVLGKLAVVLAPQEPQLQHAALRLTARGWETQPLPAPNGSGAFTIALDLRSHEAVIEHSSGRDHRIALTPNRSVGEVTREVVNAAGLVAGELTIETTPQEVAWTVPLDEDDEHATYDTGQVATYFEMATRAAAVLAEFRAPYRGRSTNVNAWWGSMDLAVSLFSGEVATPPAGDFITRNSMDAQEVAVGWWPGDHRHAKAAFYAYAHPKVEGLEDAQLTPDEARWDTTLGEFILDQADVARQADPHVAAVGFARAVFRHACTVCGWDPALLASAEGTPPPVS